MLGHLGYAFDIQEDVAGGRRAGHACRSTPPKAERLIGPDGEETLEDLQFLLNRLLQAKDRHAPRVVVDVEPHRTMQSGRLSCATSAILADQVRHHRAARCSWSR